MHPNPVYRQTETARNLAFAREEGFGVLAVCGPDGPLLSHIPFLLDEDGTRAELHLVRSNPIARLLSAPLRARLAVVGPHGYVSPDWYGVVDQVPTWNYVAVHLVGALHPLPQERLRDLANRESAHFEARLLPKPEWHSDKMTSGAMERMMRQIVPCVLEIEEIAGTWKLNQNKEDAVRLRAAGHMERDGLRSDRAALAALMRDPPG
ncbi:MAG: FMN-binding negative transcriptional regulator [Roseovarius sp.]|nr:FMN-binding negative transcriptional regulator [Roseovarius sp.]